MNAFLAYLKRYISLTTAEEHILAEKLKHRKYLKSQYIVQEGDICRYQTFVAKGKTRTFYLDEQGKEHIVMFGIENWWTGDLGSFITQKPADFNVQCLSNTEVIQISYQNQLRTHLLQYWQI